ncbi:MAG: hypothetical protein FWE19_05180 [Oscillospiraceae bacterium]|nr:hypothetical protein [Oscillospiraceae bacterium]
MARGVARSLDNRIDALREKLEKKQSEVAELKSAIKELEVAKQAELLTKVSEAAAQKGVSVEELLNAAIK